MKRITDELITVFKNYLIEEEKSQNTVEKYIRDLTAFARWAGNRELCKSLVLEYKARILEKYAPASVNSMLSSINSFFEYNGLYNLKVKTLRIQRQIFCTDNKLLTKGEYERLLLAAKNKKDKRIYYLMQTICSTGIRVSELKYIDTNAVKKGKAVINCKGKMRIVLLPKELCIKLSEYIKVNRIKKGSVFVSKNGKPLDRSYIWKLLKNISKDANVLKNKVYPHNLRHLFARTYYALQKDIVRLADILGHSRIDTTRIYTIENSNIHRKQIQSLGLLRI